MTDSELIEAFEACTLEEFHHRDHVRAAWIYLDRFPLLEALDRFTTALKRFAASHGQAGLYHETITWAFVFLIHERMIDGAGCWDHFASENEDLLRWKPSILDSYYRAGTLASPRARERFVMPDGPRDCL
jgi:hypothetical protein